MVKEKRGTGRHWWQDWELYLMALPCIVVVIIFNYIPMGGIILAFKSYNFSDGVLKSPWVGFDNFRFFFESGVAGRLVFNTVFLNTLFALAVQILGILAALFLNEIFKYKVAKVYQSVLFFPHFISWVIVGAFVYNIFNYETGLMNGWLTSLGMEKVNVYSMPWVWPIIICCFNAWKWCGYNSIIYIAAITGIDGECYEAAQIDGANIFQRIWYITLPCIKPTVITMLLLQVGRILRGDFEMFYQIVGNNGQLYNATDVIDTYVFRSLMQNSNLGMTAAATFYQSILCFIIIMLVNAVVKKIDEDYALF